MSVPPPVSDAALRAAQIQASIRAAQLQLQLQAQLAATHVPTSTPTMMETSTTIIATSNDASTSTSTSTSTSQSWKQVEGGLGGLASRYGAHNSISAKMAAEDARLDALHDMDAPSYDPYDVQQASVDVPIASDNKGYAMLLKMGWKGSTGLGKKEQGITTPIVMGVAPGEERMGLGKSTQYDDSHHDATKERRVLASEIVETEEMKKEREALLAKETHIAETVSNQNRPFYCDICDKQYTTTMEYQEHLSSYDHHHRKRMVETKRLDMQRKMGGADGIAQRQKKAERKEQEAMEARMKAAEAVAAQAAASAATATSTAPTTTPSALPSQRPAFSISFGAKPASTTLSSTSTTTSTTTSTSSTTPAAPVKIGMSMMMKKPASKFAGKFSGS